MITARPARTAALVLMGTLLVNGGLLATPAAAAASDLRLEPGAQAGALFSAGALAPGRQVSRCVAVTESNSGGSTADVRLYGTVSGPLAAGLLFTVEMGTGGSYDDCTGFSGTPVFAGTLDDFARQHTDFTSGLAQATKTATYRFTVELVNDQQWQGQSATTRFVWEAQGADDLPGAAAPSPRASPAPSPVASGSPSPTPTPAPSSPAVPTPGGTGTGTGGAPVGTNEPPSPADAPPGPAPLAGPEAVAPGGPAPSTTPDAPAPEAADDPALDDAETVNPVAPGPGTPDQDASAAAIPPAAAPGMPLERPREVALEPAQGDLGRATTQVLEALRRAAALVGQVAGTGARATGLPVGLVSLVGLFLLTQDRIDRSDPRLRLSPLHAPALLEFLPADPA